MNAKLLFRSLLGAGLFLGASLQAQVAVYRLSFESTGESINYRPYQNGYYIAPIQGGTGSLILTLVTGGQRQYFTYESFGEVFVALNGEKKKMVLSATAAGNVSTTMFYALGNVDRSIEVETRNAESKVKVATKLKGYAISADSEQDLPFTGVGNSVGVAGASLLTANYDEMLSRVAQRDNLDVAAELAVIVANLEAIGYVDGGATTPAPEEPTTPPVAEPTTPPVEEPTTPPTEEPTTDDDTDTDTDTDEEVVQP